MGTVGLLLLAMFLVVRSETARQVSAVTRGSVERAEAAFREVEEQRMDVLARAAAPFTEGVRAVAAVEEAIAGGELEGLEREIEYDLLRSQFPVEELLLAFADASGEPVLTLIHGERSSRGDPASLGPLFFRLLESGETTMDTYRVAEGDLYRVQGRQLFLGARPVGAVALGFPIRDDDATEIGDIVGVEVCFLAEGSCLAGTSAVRGSLSGAMATADRPDDGAIVPAGGDRWRVVAAPLDPAHPDEGSRVIAVPLTATLEPFERIATTLLVTGVLALLVALLASIGLARGLARPVRALVDATGRVARGDYDAEVEVDREDEMGALAGAFNEMTRGLRLKERYRGVLDKVVSREVADELVRGDLVLGGETRRATVLFADLRGFTSTTEGMEPQSVIGLLNECMETLSAAVDAEGGIVDKYVGDELMAVWGAPMARSDDALRAARAAVRMQEGMAGLNRVRSERGEQPIHVGIGVNTGEVVAGNMGSSARLNYTVLGEPVNLAARLCSAAAPGEVLLGPETVEAVGDAIPLDEGRSLALKGFSREVSVGRVARGATVAGALVGIAVAALGALFGLPTAMAAQEPGELPTLEGLAWISDDGRFQLLPAGRLDLELYVPSSDPPWLIPSTEPFLAPRMRLFLDVFAGQHVYGLVEVRGDRGEAPAAGDLEARVEQAFVRLSPGPALQLQLGRFASPFGGYGLRHLSPADPFVRPPLPYDHRTMVCPNVLPGAILGFVEWQDDPARFRPMGAPPIWSVPYQWGAMLSGSTGPVSLRAAWMNSAPSSGPVQWGWDGGRMGDGSLVLGANVAVSPALSLDVSWSLGPYLEDALEGAPLPAGRDRDDFDQEIVGAEVVWKRGASVVRGELFLDRWEVPNVGDDVRETAWYVEGQRDLLPGLFGAVRVGGIDFGSLTDEEGTVRDWDRDILRFEVGAGYRVVRNLEVRGQVGVARSDGPGDPRDDLLSLQAWWEF